MWTMEKYRQVFPATGTRMLRFAFSLTFDLKMAGYPFPNQPNF